MAKIIQQIDVNKLLTLAEALIEWKIQPGQADQEDRLEASKRIVAACRDNSSKLNLSGLGLSNLPSEIGLLDKLQKINLQDNNLTELPDGILQLKQLRVLNIGGNNIVEIPQKIDNLSKLKYLYLNKNQLEGLNPQISQLENLQIIDISDNKLEYLSDELKEKRDNGSILIDDQYNEYSIISSQFAVAGRDDDQLDFQGGYLYELARLKTKFLSRFDSKSFDKLELHPKCFIDHPDLEKLESTLIDINQNHSTVELPSHSSGSISSNTTEEAKSSTSQDDLDTPRSSCNPDPNETISELVGVFL